MTTLSNRNKLQSAPRGAALIIVFFVMILLVGISIALLQTATAHAQNADNYRDRQQALMLANAGLSAAMNEINLNKSFNGAQMPGNMEKKWGNDQYFYTRTVDNGDTTYTVTSTGLCTNTSGSRGDMVTRRIQALVSAPITRGGFIDGAFGRNSLTLTGIAHTDSYDSGLGTTFAAQVAAAGGYDPYVATTGNHGNVGSNGSISGVGGITVHGNATPGPNSSVSLTGGAMITGSTAPAPSTYNVDSYVYVPQGNSLGSLHLTGNGTMNVTAGTYRYDDIQQSGKTIMITGAVTWYIDGDLTQTGQGLIVLAAGASLTIFQGPSGKFSMAGQALTNTDGNPNSFSVVSASTSSVDITGQGQLFTNVYAPDAAVKISGQGELFGAVVGNDVTLNGQGTFHYDKNATSPGIRHNLTLVAYWEVDNTN